MYVLFFDNNLTKKKKYRNRSGELDVDELRQALLNSKFKK